ncbi:helix-turn-helix domain-containing protein [Rhodococcus rhodochrous]|uniref:helix-turn-helix domain-containing protein n=1 Tax=Rhodococcus rhodochrous TaxID=1829 RepID=UPI001E2C455E|nr:helix-turn-helix domain-containing protein [Rhodococcus rhodochrous]
MKRPADAHDELASLIERELVAAARRIAEAIVSEYLGTNGAQPSPMSGARSLGPKLLLDASEAAELLGVHRSTIREMWTASELRFIRIGRGRKVTRTELERFIAEREARPRTHRVQALH